jgi:hypothetical protein
MQQNTLEQMSLLRDAFWETAVHSISLRRVVLKESSPHKVAKQRQHRLRLIHGDLPRRAALGQQHTPVQVCCHNQRCPMTAHEVADKPVQAGMPR